MGAPASGAGVDLSTAGQTRWTMRDWMISPSFVVPFLLIIAGTETGVLTGNYWLLHALGVVMTAYGIYVCYLMLRRPEDLAVEENHVSWAHMYRMMFVAQVGFALAYLL